MVGIYTPKISSRLEYIVEVIFQEILKTNYVLSVSLDELQSQAGVIVNYSKENISDTFHIKPVKLIFEQTIQEQKIKIEDWNDMPIFF